MLAVCINEGNSAGSLYSGSSVCNIKLCYWTVRVTVNGYILCQVLPEGVSYDGFLITGIKYCFPMGTWHTEYLLSFDVRLHSQTSGILASVSLLATFNFRVRGTCVPTRAFHARLAR